ncbi:MAG: hypothetical protein ACO22R_00345 [Chitinophagaceae bacterium]|jgi:hypothetical protein
MTYKVNILDPKAKKLLLEMEAKRLISLTNIDGTNFVNLVKRIRKKSLKHSISKEEIAGEVEQVRGDRHARKKRQGNI